MNFEIATWYDTWNATGLQNLVEGKVPLGLATRYNLAFGTLLPGSGGYCLNMNEKFFSQVLAQIRAQAPGVLVYGGIGSGGLAETVQDNEQNNNRATANIVAYLQQQGMNGINIDAEDRGTAMASVAQLVTQLGPSFKAAGLGIAVSAPWPEEGPVSLYGPNAVAAFNAHVDAVELQDYSSRGTPVDARVWLEAGVSGAILMGGICTENSGVQTSFGAIAAWTQFALQNQLRGMFSWRLDNDHGSDGENEDIGPTFTGAQALYNAVNGIVA